MAPARSRTSMISRTRVRRPRFVFGGVGGTATCDTALEYRVRARSGDSAPRVLADLGTNKRLRQDFSPVLELGSPQAGVEGVELLVAVEVDDQAAAAPPPALQGDPGAERLLQAALQGGVVDAERLGGLWRASGARCGGCRGRILLLHQLLDAPHAETLRLDLAGEALLIRCGEGEEGAGVARAEPAVGDRLLHRRGEAEQAHGVADRAAAATHAQADRLVGEAEGVGEAGVRGRLLQRGELRPLQVLDQSQLEGVARRVGGGSEDGRDGGDARLLGGAEAALSGDESVAVAGQALDDDGVEQAVGLDRLGQRGDALLVEAASRLLRVGLDAAGADLDQPALGGLALVGLRGRRLARAGRRGGAGEQCVETPAQAAALRGGRWLLAHPGCARAGSAAARRMRASNSSARRR